MSLRVSIDISPGLRFRLTNDAPAYAIYAYDAPEDEYPENIWSLHLWTDLNPDPEPFCQVLEELITKLRSTHQKQKQEHSPLPPSPNSDTLSVKSSDGDYDAVQVSEASPDDEGSQAQS